MVYEEAHLQITGADGLARGHAALGNMVEVLENQRGQTCH